MRSTRLMSVAKFDVISSLSVDLSLRDPWPLLLPPPIEKGVKKPTLILDIDETLIHTFEMRRHGVIESGKQKIPIAEVRYAMRPYLKEFLQFAMKEYEVVFWTAGVTSYAASVIDGIERHVLGLPPSIYHYNEMIKGLQQDPTATNHVNFYFLSRERTLETMNYMKFIPLTGRSLRDTIMVDDNVRSFPLTPRNGVKIKEFIPYLRPGTVALPSTDGVFPVEVDHPQAAAAANDTALRDLIPLLEDVAAAYRASPEEGVIAPLNYWRREDYTETDNFVKGSDPNGHIYRGILGHVTAEKQDQPIPPPVTFPSNFQLTESARHEMSAMMTRPKL